MRLIRMEGCPLENPKVEKIKNSLLNGEIGKIPAIRAYRELYRVGLREAKDVIDSWLMEIGELVPQIKDFVMVNSNEAKCEISFSNPFYKNKWFPITVTDFGGWFKVYGFELNFFLGDLKDKFLLEKFSPTASHSRMRVRLERILGTSVSFVGDCWESSGIRFKILNQYPAITNDVNLEFEIVGCNKLTVGQFTRMMDTFLKVRR